MWIFENFATYFDHLTSKQDTETGSLISEGLGFRSRILEGWCDEDVMIHYNNRKQCILLSSKYSNILIQHRSQYSINKHTFMHRKTIFLFTMLKYSSVFIVLWVRLTKYQQIHPYTAPAAQQTLTSLFTYLLEPI